MRFVIVVLQWSSINFVLDRFLYLIPFAIYASFGVLLMPLVEAVVRAGRFVARKNWIVCGSDDFQVRDSVERQTGDNS